MGESALADLFSFRYGTSRMFPGTYECRCNKRLESKGEGSTRLVYTGLCGGLEHLNIETRLIIERFESVMGECVI
jgi:hypothetical protein